MEKKVNICFPHLSVTSNLTKQIHLQVLLKLLLTSVELDLHVLFTAVFPLLNYLHTRTVALMFP